MSDTDVGRAAEALEGHSIVLCRGQQTLISDGRGISPMLDWLAAGEDLHGFSAADMVVGRAAAMLFVLAGVVSVHARVLSRGGKEYLEKYGIPVTYGALTESIRNRTGDDICPMERAVASIDDPHEGYDALVKRRAELRGQAGAHPDTEKSKRPTAGKCI